MLVPVPPPLPPLPPLRGTHRYGFVLLLAAVAVLFAVIAPEADVSRGIEVLLQGGTLLIVIATARETPLVRDSIAALVSALLVALAVAVAVGLAPTWLGSAVAGFAVVTSLVVLVRGLLRLLRERGVTLEAVSGALAIYLLVGLLFGLAIAVAARLDPKPYFAQGADGTQSDRMYFSFTTLTTTGFGDLTAATRTGRAIAVLEELLGQIYLVTVISLLISNLRRNRPESG
jgi:prepilin signal peptidase PulO-like enzyme (type II secretory pathway)